MKKKNITPPIQNGFNKQTLIILGLVITILGIFYYSNLYTNVKLSQENFQKILKEGIYLLA